MSYQIIVKVRGVETRRIDYSSRRQAAHFLDRLLVRFEGHTNTIKTDLDQLAGVTIQLVASSYTIKKV